MSAPPAPTQSCQGGLIGWLNCSAGTAANKQGQSGSQLVAALAVSFGSLGVQLLCFAIIRLRLSRIYRPRSYLVPERERVAQPPGGIVGWLYPLFTVSNLTLIQKCGLDAYFFLRFLRMLLKIFLPMSLIVLPILLPINHSAHGGAKGLDKYSVSNLGPNDGNYLWAHTILAVLSIGWFFYVVFKELRGYIRVRQAYLTSPQHRIRASATTVLVTGIPRKWLTLEALSGLYDVFPGGIRNIWINRNFDELSDKVQLRDKIAKNLEDAETVLIKTCRKENAKAEERKAKQDGRKKKTKEEKKQDQANENAAAEQMAESGGVSAGEQGQVSHGMQDILDQEEHQQEKYDKQSHHPFGAVTHGLGAVGKGIGKFGGKVVTGADAGFHKAGDNFNRTANTLNEGGLGGGFVADDSIYGSPSGARAQPGSRPGTADSRRVGEKAAMDTIPRQTRHPLAVQSTPAEPAQGSPTSNGSTLGVPSINVNRPSADSKPKSTLQIEEPPSHKPKRKFLDIFKNNDQAIALPSPQPHIQEEDEFPLHTGSEKHPEKTTEKELVKSSWTDKLAFWKSKDDDKPKEEYPSAFDKDWDEDQDEEPYWRRYIEPKDRETIRLPLFSPSWFPSIPFVGKKVDRIYHLRQELARLNLEIETDQNDVEKFPYMNSAFIQFNHQVAAHMCCQSLSHHVPQQMSPRLVEISPDDVIWDNMSIKWWERYLRTGVVLIICAALVVLYAIPVAFTSIVGQITQLATFIPWLSWLLDAPKWIQSVIQGVLPPVLLSLILLLVPIIFRLLVQQQGVPTGNAKELGVQQWYFVFLFIQVFLVVTITGGLTKFFSNLASNPGSIVQTLAKTLPAASNYFYSYLTVQALSNSASALVQTGGLFAWFILAPMLDSTARAKWRRQTTLSNVQWGSFFPPFTNFAAIGVIYSVISPLMLVFMLFVFSLFWIVYRYNVLFVYQFRVDTGGRLFPVAINQLFTGLYFLELCMIGLCFTLAEDPAIAQAVILIVVLVATVAYQILINMAFKPLFQYLPITLEDEAVIRDEEFARAQASKFAPLTQAEDTRDIQDVLEDHEREDDEAGDVAEDDEKRRIAEHKRNHTPHSSSSPDAGRQPSTPQSDQGRWHERKESKPIWATDRWKRVAPEAVGALRFIADGKRADQPPKDPEAQHTVGDVLFSGFADELEDLSPEDRDLLVRYSFQHSALRARRPVVWIPRDVLGVSDDEIKRAKKMSTVMVESADGDKEEKTNIWMSNDGTALDSKGRVVFRKSPPDFSNVDLISM
ncbi:hypothetical protein M409DRAFT_24573 [Zasmidium cellare ATCC 36951]|uniref:DUF221-domain-containing protein n=1 Tax=Zasmidium cellare ATCC 36951 TaxID=1080233 RepID=A0A6A6CHM1_ZASCE|nr:uncharacterized protein M409DRAFT_24573 [Zasmidium cellare ATCC 36951]KAF2165189.1 hypothetical protein M409DRAFT_24573 [Zasmidium cellare ATCC 36951]